MPDDARDIATLIRPDAPGMDAAATAPAVLVDDDALQVSHRPGRSGLTVISFSGVGLGHLAGPRRRDQQAEFVGTLAELGTETYGQVFVIDRRRSWLNGVADRLVPLLREVTAGERAVITLGNSMGGFAATWIAGLLPRCIRAIAMAPQFSVNPDWVPEEKRWPEYRAAIGTHAVGHAFDHRARGVEYWAFFGADKNADARHAALFREHGGEELRLLTLDEAGHDVSRLIKRARALSPLIGLLMREGPVALAEVEALLAGAGLRGHDAVPDRRQARRAERRAMRVAARQESRRQANG